MPGRSGQLCVVTSCWLGVLPLGPRQFAWESTAAILQVGQSVRTEPLMFFNAILTRGTVIRMTESVPIPKLPHLNSLALK